MDLYMMNCELLATCSALGYLEGDTYHKEPDCLESVKDLIRYLRHEDDTRDIRQQLGAAQILQNDLLPVITQYHQDKQLFDTVIRLMVNLTQPALLCFGKVPQDPAFRHHFLQVVSYLQAYKEAFANEKVFGVLSEKLYDLLQLDWEQRHEEDNLLIERLLLLVRNVLHIPADPEAEKNVDDDASVHDKVLWAIHMSGMDDLIKFLASSQTEEQWSMHVLEIVSLLFRDQNSEQLATTGQARTTKAKENDVVELEMLRQREIAEKKNRTLQRGTRHSRFGGSYVVQGLKSIGDRDVVYHKKLLNFKNYSHDMGKAAHRVPKRRQAAKETENQRRSALNVRLFLKEFCIDFLENCYNRLMYIVKDNLIREKTQQHDETYYLWSMSFFMDFNRIHRFRPELVSETVSIRTFHFIEQNLTNYYEMMLMDKKEAFSWSRRMHLALKAYQELLTTVHEMDRSKEEAVRDSSKIIKSNIFYLMEYRELFLTLFRKFDETKQPKSFLKDLIETTHLFTRMMEKFCKSKNNIVVQTKKVKRKKRAKGHKASAPQEKTLEELEEVWNSLLETLSNCVKDAGAVPEDIVPFDVTSEVPVEEQRADAMVHSCMNLVVSVCFVFTLCLFPCDREVWPEGDVFGSTQLGPEEELQLLKQILVSNLPRQAAPEAEETEEMGEEELEDEEVESFQVSEREFNFLDYIKRFASCNVVKAYILLLKNYRHNTAHTNHCIVKMLHRIAYDLKMEALLFQLSIFCLFNRILSDPAASAYKELVTFAKYILSKFFVLAEKNNKVCVELLFWKNTATVQEMTEGYRKPGEEDSDGKKRSKWSPAEEEELRNLYLQYRENEDADVLDNVMANMRNKNRTRRQLASHLVHMGLANSVKEFKREKKGMRIVVWTEEQELELQTLFEEFRNTDDVLGNIMKFITAKRSKARIVEKLMSLGLVSDRKELYKKRKRKGRSGGQTEEEFLNDLGLDVPEDSSEEEDEDESEEEKLEESRTDEPNKREKEEKKSVPGGPDRALQGLVHRLRQEGLSGPLLWLQNCLNRTADDREEDGSSQPVPVVPLTEENEDAMENKQFQKLLRKLGVKPPANEQESFWRIQANLSPLQLRRTATSLSMSEMGEEEEEEVMEKEDLPGRVPSEEQRSEALRALLLARNKKSAQPMPVSANAREHARCAVMPSVSANAREHARYEEMRDAEEQTKRALESDSESDTDNVSEGKRTQWKPASKRSRMIDSDDEEIERTGETDHVEPALESDPEKSPAPTKWRCQQIEEEEDED
uniref:Timeless circadian regulator n=1 Tax=Latimeria chalumnae TaxID=7897 RepID=H3BID0_LATCH